MMTSARRTCARPAWFRPRVAFDSHCVAVSVVASRSHSIEIAQKALTERLSYDGHAIPPFSSRALEAETAILRFFGPSR